MKVRYVLFCSFLVFINFSCVDFLDKEPDDMLTLEMVFDDKKRVEEWLSAIYKNTIPDITHWHHPFQNLTDDVLISSELVQWLEPFPIQARQGNWSPTTHMGGDLWEDTYKTVRSALIFMENVKPLPEQSLTADDVEFMKMEARFLMAYGYSRMLSLYGSFPLITELIPSDASVADLMQSRTPFDEILDYLDAELLELSEFFPTRVPEESNQFGRPTKGICLAVRGRMLLYAASPLFNGNPDYTDVVNEDGTPIFSNNYNIDKWKRAADANKAVIDLAETGVYSLYIEENEEGNIDPFLSYQNSFLKSPETNKEIIFANPNNYSGIVQSRFPRGAGGQGWHSATQNLVDKFFMRNGLPITDPNSGYVEEGFTEESIFYENTLYDQANPERTPGLVVEKGTYNMYANREPRFYVSIRFNNQYIPIVNRNTQYYHGGMDGRPSHDSPQCGIHPKKFVSPEDRPLENRYSYRVQTLIRLGEIYLNYVEALNEYDPGNPDIQKYINLIRERAGIPVYEPEDFDDQNKVRELILLERRVELAFENEIRYNDLRRLKIAEEVYGNEPTMGMNVWGDSPETFYTRTVVMENVFDKKMYLWPIYQKHIDNNPNLVQNKFW